MNISIDALPLLPTSNVSLDDVLYIEQSGNSYQISPSDFITGVSTNSSNLVGQITGAIATGYIPSLTVLNRYTPGSGLQFYNIVTNLWYTLSVTGAAPTTSLDGGTV